MKILITSGGTKEYIDEVRVLTNISSGKLGCVIIEELNDSEYDIYHIRPKHSYKPHLEFYNSNYNEFICDTVFEVNSKMEELVPDMDVVIHAMAMSDFTFNRENPIKLKSNDMSAFIEYMKENIQMNPKVINSIKKWNPKAILFGFKFEVGLSSDQLIDVAYNAMEKYDGDYVIANDKKMMNDAKSHVGYLIDREKNAYNFNNKIELSMAIKLILYKIFKKGV